MLMLVFIGLLLVREVAEHSHGGSNPNGCHPRRLGCELSSGRLTSLAFVGQSWSAFVPEGLDEASTHGTCLQSYWHPAELQGPSWGENLGQSQKHTSPSPQFRHGRVRVRGSEPM